MATTDALLSPTFYRQLQQLKIRTRRAFLGSRQGTHLTTRHGHGLEFADYRAYAVGDDYRHIDWGVYGRSDKLYIKQFREEQNLHVSMLLDTSASMGFPKGEGKFRRAQELALALSYISLTDGHTVTLSLLGDSRSPNFSGAHAIGRVEKMLLQTTPFGAVDLQTEIRASVARLRLPGKCFIISDFLSDADQITKSIDMLRARNFEIVLLHVLSPSELRLPTMSETIFCDAETGEEIVVSLDKENRTAYARALSMHVQALEDFCHKRGIVHLLIPSEQPLQEVLFARLPALGVVG